ncbi:MAG: hexokinase [Sphaerochaetaceae bacterium]|nr:hexokinase [Sphaerochaetaceae bacterium]
MDAKEFLNKWKIDADSLDMDRLVGDFVDHMKHCLRTHDGSLHMIPSYCSAQAKPVSGETAIVLDAGGTNFRTCLVRFTDQGPVISDFVKSSMPGSKEEVSAEDFFGKIADQVEPFIDKADHIGFCFSYATEITPDLDGKPIFFSKEIKAPQVIGMSLGKSLLAELGRRGHDVASKKVAVVNDTVATLLAGIAGSKGHEYSSYVGFILGTGTNTAYIEQNENIPGMGKEGQQIINVESGCYAISLTELDHRFLQTTKDPSQYQFEKMISGAYLGPLCGSFIRQACQENVFSSGFAASFDGMLDTIEMSRFNENPFDSSTKLGRIATDEKDKQSLHVIIGEVIRRSAKLTAANLASAVIASGKGQDPTRPVLINADGSTFYKTWNLMRYTDFYLYGYLRDKGLHYEFTQIPDSPTLGAAIAALDLKS